VGPVSWRLELPRGAPAAELAVVLLGIPPDHQTPARIDRLARGLAPRYRPGVFPGPPLPGGYRLGPWLWWVAAPGRVVLEVELQELSRQRA
jgi:hypothetical protein